MKRANKLRGMAGLRNLLAHIYAKVDPQILTDIAVNKLPVDAPDLLRVILDHAKSCDINPKDEAIGELFKRYGVKIALLFGSRRGGRAVKGDYDLAVYFGRHVDAYDVGRLAVDFVEHVGIALEDLDLVIIDSAPLELALEALYGDPLYVEDEDLLFHLRWEKTIQYLDLKRSLTAVEESALKRLLESAKPPRGG